MRVSTSYNLTDKYEDLKDNFPVPERIPQEGFNAKADKNNPTNTPTMNEYGQLDYPWQKAAPGFINGTNNPIKITSPSFNQPRLYPNNSLKTQKEKLIDRYGMF